VSHRKLGRGVIHQFIIGVVIASLIFPIGFTLLNDNASAEGSIQPEGFWPMERGNPQRNATSIFNISEMKPGILWDIDMTKMAGWNTSSRLFSAPFTCVGEDGTIYLANDKNVSAINPNGALKWTIGLNDTQYMCPAIGENGDLYIGAGPPIGQPNRYSALYAISQNGSIRWRLQLPEINPMPLLVDESNTIYASVYEYEPIDQYNITVTSYVLVAITPEGSIQWKYTLPVESEFSSVCIPAMAPDGTIRFQTESTLAAINKNGTTRWTYDLPSRKRWELNAPLVTENGTTITVCNQTLMAIDPEGRLLWTYVFVMSMDSYSRRLIYSNHEIFIYNAGGPDFIAAIWDNGTLAWTIYDSDFSYYGPVMSKNGVILILNDFNQLEAIAANGTRLWETEPLYTASSSTDPTEIVIGAKDRIYLRHSNVEQDRPVILIAVGYEDEQQIASAPPIWAWMGFIIVMAVLIGGFLLWRRSK
jgi:outer membrane protein assembly factor BamB